MASKWSKGKMWHGPILGWRKLTVKRTKPNPEAKFSQFLVDRGLHKLIWVRLDLAGKRNDPTYRVWLRGKFLSEDFFMTRENHSRGATLYHLCHRWDRWVFYSRVKKGKSICHCGVEVPGGFVMLRNLRDLKI